LALLNVCCKSGCCICCTDYIRMLQMYFSNISAVLTICCKYFYLIVAYIPSVCCKCFMYSDVCCSKYFMWQVFHQQARLGCAGRGGPLRCSGPCMCSGSQVGVTAGTEHKTVWSTKLHPCSTVVSLSLFQPDAAVKGAM
jgi:hypothetical protein